MRRHESREPSDGVHSDERAGHGDESRARELVEARATSFAEPLRPTSVKIASSRGGLIKSKRAIRRSDKDAGLSTGGFVSAPNTEACTQEQPRWGRDRTTLKNSRGTRSRVWTRTRYATADAINKPRDGKY